MDPLTFENSEPIVTASSQFHRLEHRVQEWFYKRGWDKLHAIQEQAIPIILRGDSDLIISAATAAGKTEAAFLPCLSSLAMAPVESIGILAISPLKALINDQFNRLELLAEELEQPLVAWHGDSSQAGKKRLKKTPRGVLMITPESLESQMIRNMHWCRVAFAGLRFVIIDEFHAFLDSERGRQLQSLLHRLERLIERPVPRIALSATLSQLDMVAEQLRPNQLNLSQLNSRNVTSGQKKLNCEIIRSDNQTSDIMIQLRGYSYTAKIPLELDKINDQDLSPETTEETTVSFTQIIDDLYKLLRGKSHLVFANSRKNCETITASLSILCEKQRVPNEFFAHHGNLSKELRESLEQRLQSESIPTTAVCTMTLELGIDIGKVHSIAQVTPPHGVASLRQRLGRSGRRGEEAILRCFIPEAELSKNSLINARLRIDTVKTMAMIELLIRKWVEPPGDHRWHFSTLVQQTLAVVAQYGGVQPEQIWRLLCQTGPFAQVSAEQFALLLRSLGAARLITQGSDGQIIIGDRGETLVSNYKFYAAFETPEEYRLECEGRIIGSMPIDFPLVIDQHIIFGGRYWQVMGIDQNKRLILLKKTKGGQAPRFGGSGTLVHDRVRQEMFTIYGKGRLPAYLNAIAKAHFLEGLQTFNDLKLHNNRLVESGNKLYVFTWAGDRIVNTLVALLGQIDHGAVNENGIIATRDNPETFIKSLEKITKKAKPTEQMLASSVVKLKEEKFDEFVPMELLQLGYGEKNFDIERAYSWIEKFLDSDSK